MGVRRFTFYSCSFHLHLHILKFHQAISNAANDIYAFDSKSNFFFFLAITLNNITYIIPNKTIKTHTKIQNQL